jgi:hypothetical protein
VAREGRDGGVAMMAASDNNGDGGQRQWQMTMAVDNNGTLDWVVDYDGEGQEWV